MAEVRLDHELRAAEADADVVAVSAVPVGRVPLDVILVPPASDPDVPRVVTWEDVPLGAAPTFVAGTGIRDGVEEDSDGVVLNDFFSVFNRPTRPSLLRDRARLMA